LNGDGHALSCSRFLNERPRRELDPYGIALAAAALFIFPQTAIWSAVLGS